MTPRQEVPTFVFNVGQTAGAQLGEAKPNEEKSTQGPMAMSYKEEVGQVDEGLGSKNGHWKQKVRENRPKNLKDQSGPLEVKSTNPSHIKRESWIL